MTASSTPLRVGLVGAGSMGRQHAQILRGNDRVRLVGVADPDEAAAREAAVPSSGARVFTSLDDLVHGADVDAVHVCSPPALHYDHARAALEAGCHVYVEKPFTQRLKKADRLLRLVDSSNLKICAGHQLKHAFSTDRTRRALEGVAPVCHIESHFHFKPSAAKDSRLRADEQLLDVLPHPTYLLLHFLALASRGEASASLGEVTTGPGGTLHAQLRRGEVTGFLHVTLEGRPVDSHVRVVGKGGTASLDYILEAVYSAPDRSGSGLGKILNPLSLSRQIAGAALRAGGRHALGRGTSYPGLSNLIDAFYAAILSGSDSPVPKAEIRSTVRIVEEAGRALEATAPGAPEVPAAGTSVAVTGGTGFLGRPTVEALVEAGGSVRSLSRRGAPPWERVPGVKYLARDLSEVLPVEAFADVDVVVHAAAATSGGWETHRKHSVQATENVLRAAARAGVERIVYVSSLAVVEPESPNTPISEDSPLIDDTESAGPYTWGKTEAERRARALADELGLKVKVVRPGAVIDPEDYEPPGKLGRQVGSVFVAVGSPEEELGIVERGFVADVLASGALHFDDLPSTLNLLAPDLPTRRELVDRLRDAQPGVTVVWLPRIVLEALDPIAVLAQRAMGRGQQPISLSNVFRKLRYDTTTIREFSPGVQKHADPAPRSRLRWWER